MLTLVVRHDVEVMGMNIYKLNSHSTTSIDRSNVVYEFSFLFKTFLLLLFVDIHGVIFVAHRVHSVNYPWVAIEHNQYHQQSKCAWTQERDYFHLSNHEFYNFIQQTILSLLSTLSLDQLMSPSPLLYLDTASCRQEGR